MTNSQCLFPAEENDIPDDPDEALRENALRRTHQAAKTQAQAISGLVDDIAKTALDNMVEGEELLAASPHGMQMYIAK